MMLFFSLIVVAKRMRDGKDAGKNPSKLDGGCVNGECESQREIAGICCCFRFATSLSRNQIARRKHREVSAEFSLSRDVIYNWEVLYV